MRVEMITPKLIRRIEQFNSQFNAGRFAALRDLPGNPYAVELRSFGEALAIKNGSSELRSKQRVTKFTANDAAHLADLLEWYRREGLRCSIQIDYNQMTTAVFRQFIRSGLISRGSAFGTVWMDAVGPKPSPAGLVIRESPDADREEYLDLFQRCFAGRGEEKPDYRPIQWAEDALPNGKRYIAELAGEPVGFASMPILGGVALCGTAGTLHAFRGRGVQQALIHHRIAEAGRLHCSLMLGGADLDSTEHRNFIRCGFRMLPLGMSWSDPADRLAGA